MYSELKRIVCPKCKIEKEANNFGKDATNAKGISCWCKKCKKEWRSNWRKENPDKAKKQDFKNDLAKNYKITPDHYWKMFEDQGGCCACCGISHVNHRRGLHVDHDHTTGQVRGLLCTRCNPGIGYFDHSIDKLEMAITYIKKFEK